MRKYAYLARLEELLAALPAQERQDALNYYEEYFDAAGSENEEQTAAELGDPAEVARNILEGEGVEPPAPAAAEPPAPPRGETPAAPQQEPPAGESAAQPAPPQPPAAPQVAPAAPPAAPQPPALDDPEHYPASGVTTAAKGRKSPRRLWLVFWLLVGLALIIQVSVLLLGLARPGASAASMEVAESTPAAESAPAVEEGPVPTAATAGLTPSGSVIYVGTLPVPGNGTLYVNMICGNVSFRIGPEAKAEVRSVDVSDAVQLKQTVGYGWALTCDSTDPSTHVTIVLPANAYDRVEVDIEQSGAIELGNLQIKEICASTQSGMVQSGVLRTRALDVQTQDGNIWLEEVAGLTGYDTESVTLQAPQGTVTATLAAPRAQWHTTVQQAGGEITEAEAQATPARTLYATGGEGVNLTYGEG